MSCGVDGLVQPPAAFQSFTLIFYSWVVVGEGRGGGVNSGSVHFAAPLRFYAN